MVSMILAGNIIQKLAEVKDNILSYIKVRKLSTTYMFQDKFLNKAQKASTIQYALQ